jgi:hypothetical protein
MSIIQTAEAGLGVSRTKLRCAAHTLRCAALTLRCNGCRCVQLPVERCSGAVHCCRLRCDATSSACQVGPTLGVLKDHSRGALGRCNRLRWDATGDAAIQQAVQRPGGPECSDVCDLPPGLPEGPGGGQDKRYRIQADGPASSTCIAACSWALYYEASVCPSIPSVRELSFVTIYIHII